MKNRKGNVAVIALIIILVAITAGVLGWMFAKKTQIPATAPFVTQPTSSVSADKISGWQTYKSEEYGFEFQYPPECLVDAQQKDYIKFRSDILEFVVSIQTELSGERVLLGEEMTIGSQTWIKQEVPGEGGSGWREYTIIPGDKRFEFIIPEFRYGYGDNPGDSERYKNILSENASLQMSILSTFRFTK